jgi:hypothetical protein
MKTLARAASSAGILRNLLQVANDVPPLYSPNNTNAMNATIAAQGMTGQLQDGCCIVGVSGCLLHCGCKNMETWVNKY